MRALEGQVALVTGGGRGIGRAIAVALAAAGAAVTITGRSEAALEATRAAVAAAGGTCLAVPCDVADTRSVEAAFARSRQALGPAGILVNNAGITASAKFVDTDEALWERIMQVNVGGAFRCCKAAVPEMIAAGGGRIINIASIAATVGMPFSAPYSASKHALLGLTRSLALELARAGITVNAICPGWVETDMFHASVENVAAKTGRGPEDARAALLSMGGQQRAIAPEEIAAVAVRLAGPEGARTTGDAIMMS